MNQMRMDEMRGGGRLTLNQNARSAVSHLQLDSCFVHTIDTDYIYPSLSLFLSLFFISVRPKGTFSSSQGWSSWMGARPYLTELVEIYCSKGGQQSVRNWLRGGVRERGENYLWGSVRVWMSSIYQRTEGRIIIREKGWIRGNSMTKTRKTFLLSSFFSSIIHQAT